LKVLDILSATTERRDKLERNTGYWRKGLTEAGFILKEGDTPIVPVMLYNAKLAQEFQLPSMKKESMPLASSSRLFLRVRPESEHRFQPLMNFITWTKPWRLSLRLARNLIFSTKPNRKSSTNTGCRRF